MGSQTVAFQTGHFHGHVSRRFDGARQGHRILMLYGPKSGRWQSMTPAPARTIMAGLLIKELLIRGDLINDIKSLLSG